MGNPIAPTSYLSNDMTVRQRAAWPEGLDATIEPTEPRNVLKVRPTAETSLTQRLRVALLQSVFHPLQGMSFSMWLRLLRQNRFQVDAAYWPLAASWPPRVRLIRRPASRKTPSTGRRSPGPGPMRPVPPRPFPEWYDIPPEAPIARPAIRLAELLPGLFPPLFPSDRIRVGADPPGVLEPASPPGQCLPGNKDPRRGRKRLCAMTLLSPYLNDVFRRTGEDCSRYTTFRDVNKHERDEWKEAFAYYCSKLTYFHKKTLLLKSPPHTGRIELLLEVFPEARFVSIHRNPYEVFASTFHMIKSVEPAWRLQNPTDVQLDRSHPRIVFGNVRQLLRRTPPDPRGTVPRVRLRGPPTRPGRGDRCHLLRAGHLGVRPI